LATPFDQHKANAATRLLKNAGVPAVVAMVIDHETEAISHHYAH
jgi:hypothetical protein